jgi:hypothetical protein
MGYKRPTHASLLDLVKIRFTRITQHALKRETRNKMALTYNLHKFIKFHFLQIILILRHAFFPSRDMETIIHFKFGNNHIFAGYVVLF